MVALPSAVLFDAGGVLLLPRGDQLSDLFRAIGIDVEPETSRDGWSRALAECDQEGDLDPTEVRRRWVRHAGAAPEQVARAEAMLHDEMTRRHVDWHESVDGAAETLRALRTAGYRLGCISNSNGSVADELAFVGLAEYFEVIVDSHVVGIEKPDPRIFSFALEAMGRLPPDECVYIGDTLHYDVKPAIRAGLTACHLDRMGLYRAPLQEGARIGALPELLELVGIA